MNTLPDDIQDTIYKYKHQLEYTYVLDDIKTFNTYTVIETYFSNHYHKSSHLVSDVSIFLEDWLYKCDDRWMSWLFNKFIIDLIQSEFQNTDLIRDAIDDYIIMYNVQLQ